MASQCLASQDHVDASVALKFSDSRGTQSGLIMIRSCRITEANDHCKMLLILVSGYGVFKTAHLIQLIICYAGIAEDAISCHLSLMSTRGIGSPDDSFIRVFIN